MAVVAREQKKMKEDEQSRVLPSCQFATLAMLSGSVTVLLDRAMFEKNNKSL